LKYFSQRLPILDEPIPVSVLQDDIEPAEMAALSLAEQVEVMFFLSKSRDTFGLCLGVFK
jgi:hypothetical protein